jgi:FdhD protein
MPDDLISSTKSVRTAPARSALDPLRQLRAPIERWQESASLPGEDELVVEEPLEIRVETRVETREPVAGMPATAQFETLAVVLRTPGNDEELVAGFLFTEGLLQGADELRDIRLGLDGDGLPSDNVREVVCSPEVDLAARIAEQGYSRRFAVNASCGVCGKNTVAAACSAFPHVAPATDFGVRADVLYHLPSRLGAQQRVFHATGGLHAAALFDPSGSLVALREDVGRHNAVDKLVGRALLDGALPLSHCLLLVSGRLSFEIILKALAARIPLIAALSAPSSLAVELAEASGITLAAFLRGSSMNVYTHSQRVHV